jgi:hypothetical protein
MFEVEIQRGVSALDQSFNGTFWLRKIRPATIEMRSCSRCILGQVFGDFLDGTEILWGCDFGESTQALSRSHGFWLDQDEYENYEHLQSEWLVKLDELCNRAPNGPIST